MKYLYIKFKTKDIYPEDKILDENYDKVFIKRNIKEYTNDNIIYVLNIVKYLKLIY